jgi:hypothetical protein
VLAICSPAARADLYRYIDPGTGWLVYSNQRLDLPLATLDFGRAAYPIAHAGPEAAPRTIERKKPPQAVTPSDFPKVSTVAQRSRDSERRSILREEMEAEQVALAAAIQKKAAADIIHRHEANIVALQHELANTK